MAEEEEPRRSNGRDQPPISGDRRPADKGSEQRGGARSKRVSRPPSVNAIQATRKPRKNHNTPAPAAATAAAPADPQAAGERAAAAASPAGLPHGDSDPWTVPESVRNRFVQDGRRFYFPDGAPAFKDHGRRLTTPSENTHVIHSLIEIAHSRGWTEVTVTGTERFRLEAWRLARIAGLNVRGYRPSDVEHAQMIRALARNRAQPAERVDSLPADFSSDAPRPSSAPPPEAVSRPDAASQGRSRERIVGKLMDHGRDAYRHDPKEDPSYFVRLQTRDGPREVWGKDIERAVAKSLTQPQVGDEVILERSGRDAVTVQRRARDSEGQLKEKAVEVYRNRWVIEKRDFFEQRATAAQLIRDEAIAPREAVRQHPEIAGTYLNLRAAELASRGLRDPEDQRRFVAQVRGALADHIERGEPLQPVRLRERAERKIVEDPERVR
jgi:conjugative element/phage-associated large polyvalent protein